MFRHRFSASFPNLLTCRCAHRRYPDRVGVVITLSGSRTPGAVVTVKLTTVDCSLPMWKKFYEITRDYFGKITIADLTQTDSNGGNYVI